MKYDNLSRNWDMMIRLIFAVFVLLQLQCGSTESTDSTESAETLADAKGYLSYSEKGLLGSQSLIRTHFVFDACKVLDLEGVFSGDYEIRYVELYGVKSGCALLYKGSDGGKCAGTPTKTVKLGDTLKLTEADGQYWGVQYGATC